jgi:hypothetical protein
MKRLMVLMSVLLVFGMVSFVSAQSCQDSDNGLIYNTKGTTTSVFEPATLEERGLDSSDGLVVTSNTTATWKSNYDVKDVTLGENVVFSALPSVTYKINKINYYSDGNSNNNIEIIGTMVSEDECQNSQDLIEYACLENNAYPTEYTCDGACSNGKCTAGVERVTCEIDYGETFANNVICNVQYDGISASCTIQADNDPYNICYPEPTINIEKPTPDEGYSPVQGLSGTFQNIQCGEIETAYNTNGFFVNCKSPSDEEDSEVCSDSDDGKDYFNSGIVSSPENAYEKDNCNLGVLTEYYCEDDTTKEMKYTCEYGCSDDGESCAKTQKQVKTIKIKGILLDELTKQPISGAELMSAYEFTPSNVITNENGYFEFSVSDDFIIKEGSEEGMSDNGGTWNFYANCYGWTDAISLRKNYEKTWSDGTSEKWDLALTESRFDNDENEIDISGKSEVDLGNLYAYPSVDISILTDIDSSFDVMYKYKNSEGYNGGGQSGYTKEHYLSTALPLGYDVFIQFEDEAGNEHKSSTYHIPLDAGCGVVSLNYFNGESKWSVVSEIEPNDNTGPIDIPEEIENNEEVSSRICMGCLKDKKCYPLGYRKSGEYCSENNEFIEQSKADLSCDNNFECSSNLCIDGECLSSSLWQKFISWLKKIFG